MTREEAKRYIGELKMYAKSQGWDEEYQIACDVAMNELEQEPILDKIRAEIKALTSNRGFLSCSVDYIHEKIDAVFDKYKAESEDKE